MAKRTAPTTSTAGPAFPPLGLVVGPGAPAANSLHHASHSYSHSHNTASSSPPTEPSHPANGLPPAPNKFDVSQAQQCRLQDAYWSDEEEDMDCPLCLEEIDLSDANFKPCPCGYQICRFCWHHIKQNLNGRCPACRRKYSDQTVEFKPMTAEEIKRLTQAKKQKEREKKELESMNRKHLANMRVVQKNLVYVVGLSSKLAKEELIPTLRSNEYFGQYGRISKILISKRNTASKLVMGTSETALGVYVTYHRKEDAAKAIVAIDGSKGSDGRIIRASYGTTKYCTTYLRNLPCTNPGCTYLHEPGEEADSFTKEDLSTLRHAAKDTEHKIKPASLGIAQPPKRSDFLGAADAESSALPKTASWASGKPMSAASSPAPLVVGSPFRDSDMPPLSASSASALARKLSSQKPSTPKVQKQSASKSKLALATGRPDSPALLGTDSPSQSQPSSPVPSRAVAVGISADLGSTASAAAAAAATSTPRKETNAQSKVSTTTTIDTAIPPPPGLVKPSSPPGLARSASTTDSRPATPHTESDHPKSSYQPSSSAQALLDDMLQRREAQPELVKPSPFPDFDDALSSFKDGDFSFNLPANPQLANNDGASELTSAFTTFSPFGAPPGVLAAHASLVTAGTPPPSIMRTPNRSSTASPAPLSYSGSFDPFAPGAGETIKQDGSSFGESNYPSSFSLADPTRRTFADGGIAGLPSDDALESGQDASKRASRFDFAKRKESDSFMTASPLRTELIQGFRGDVEGYGAGKDVTSLLGSVFDQDASAASRLNGLGDGGASAAAFGLHGRETGGFPGMGLSRPPPGIGGPGFGGRFGTNTPPPGISAPASRQQQALLASLHQLGGSGLGSDQSQQQQQQQQSQLTNGSGVSFLAELQQQAAQRAQQQAQFASGRDHSEGSRPNGSGNANPSDPLLAHLLAGRRTNYGGQSGGTDMPFGDPAIMSMTRAQMQAAQQQQQQQQQFGGGNRYGANMGGFGGVSSFSPFDQMNNANAGFGSASQYGDHQRFVQQQQQQQQGQGQGQGQGQASPYPNMS
ncbi:related to MOT2-transcriptional repressor [Sporisorium reilianum SRZ2]|uniref:Related to MOT2-transcriptional repressor n=1 Tax=Sporisorium reilianum (strain SRZ2) TaxID=999809 RepID=E7A0S8_SPORE|nr:related to MOT2-transcriptional repressor [Sporisorium reilianum SRZ2]